MGGYRCGEKVMVFDFFRVLICFEFIFEGKVECYWFVWVGRVVEFGGCFGLI